MKKISDVDQYLKENEHWLPVLTKLRKIVLQSGLEETIKWSAPVYTFEGKNIVGLGAFKQYSAAASRN